MRRTNAISKVMKSMKELQLVTLQIEKVKARAEYEKRRMTMFMEIYRNFLNKNDMKAADLEDLEIAGVDPRDRFTATPEVKVTMEKLKDKIQKASAVQNQEMRENLSEAVERNDVSDFELHDMGTILLEEQEGEVKRKFSDHVLQRCNSKTLQGYLK